MKRVRVFGLFLLIAAILICGRAKHLLAADSVSATNAINSLTSKAKAKAPHEVIERLFAQPDQEFIVLYKDDPALLTDEPQSITDSKQSKERKKRKFKETKNRVHQKFDSNQLQVLTDYDMLPMSHVRSKFRKALTDLLNNEDVAAVYEIEELVPHLAESLPLIGQPEVALDNHKGAGTTVVVLDTGIDYTVAPFNCVTPGEPGCPVEAAFDTAPDDSNMDDNGHGTNVSGIVHGVAPETKLVVIDVFDGTSATNNDVIEGINWAIENQETYNIVAMNLSIGSFLFCWYSCPTSWAYIPFQNAREANIIPIVASGNNGCDSGLSSPACAPGAVSVGAVYDSDIGSLNSFFCDDATTAADQVACWSNSCDRLDLLAPGSIINAAGISMSGTSQAAPHVAGAVAVLRAADVAPGDSLEQTITLLKLSGFMITDLKNNVQTPRIDLLVAVDDAISSYLSAQREVLIELYNNTDGTNWTNKANWLGPEGTECTWFGVTCDSQGFITSINLKANGLKGNLPAELGDLFQLRNLDISNNDLSGVVPTELLNLTNLVDSGSDFRSNHFYTSDPVLQAFLYEKQTGGDWASSQTAGPVPNIVGMTPEQAEAALHTVYLTIGNITNGCSAAIPVGNIISSDPLAGTPVAPGTVDIVISLGAACTEIPNVVNMTQATAESTIVGAGLAVGVVTRECHETIPIGNIISSNPPAGTPVELGTTVDLVVSIGPPVSKRELLIALYNNTGGDNWTNKSGWKTPPLEPDGFAAIGTENTWYGVTCDSGNNYVTQININNNNLTGTIPSEIGNHTSLLRIFLYSNKLSGAIPPEIGNLTNLTYLDLHSNQISGSIPPEIGNLTNIQSLSLNINQLSGLISSEIGNLTKLTTLRLYSNQLSGSIPPEIGNLTNLTDLDLHSNQISGGIPSEIGNLTSLQSLYLYSNQLSGLIPPEIWNLTNLTTLFLDINQLSGSIPPEIRNLTELRSLNVTNNRLSGSIPHEIGDLTKLTTLRLYSNQLSGSMPPEIGNLTNLTSLVLSNNQLSGSIPPEIGNLTKLTSLSLDSNQLSGLIPPEIGNLTNLTFFSLYQNQLSGPIPSTIGNLTKLTSLYLYNNQLSGPIPPEIGNLTKLTSLSLNNNQLSGSIPSATGSLTSLQYLYLYNNQLSGPIPSGFGNLTNLTTLSLYNNQLSGSIPSSIGNLTKLTTLYLYDNQLSGLMPSEIGNLTSLQYLDLDDNQVSGVLPSTLGNLTALKRIDVSHNLFAGPVPSSLMNLTNLTNSNSDFRWNNLFTTDSALRTFLNTKQIGGNWVSYQSGPVPDVVDMPQSAAEAAITSVYLAVGVITTACNNTIAAGNIISSNPSAGSSVAPGTAVNLVVSTGPCFINVPDVVALTQAAAESAITSAGLTKGNITTACNNTVAAGNVISSDPIAGTQVAPGTPVELLISTGPCLPLINDVISDDCISEIRTAGIKVIATDPSGGTLTYTWEALNGGLIIGEGADVVFDPSAPSTSPACEPYRVKLTVTSDETGLNTIHIIEIHVKLAGDVNGDGVVNIIDKVQVRDHFGQSGDPGWINADVNGDGVVNIIDKVRVRDQFGQSGCGCP